MVTDRRHPASSDRRRHPRGGRRTEDVEGRHPRILIADAYEAARRPCARYLEHFAFDVVACGDGEGDGIVREIDERRPAVILMGTNLTNPPATRLLDRAVRTAGIPVILFADTAGQALEGDLSAASGVLVKPFTLGGMLETVRAVLRDAAAATAQ
jgi:DNA-binding response OmpR family regulator